MKNYFKGQFIQYVSAVKESMADDTIVTKVIQLSSWKQEVEIMSSILCSSNSWI